MFTTATWPPRRETASDSFRNGEAYDTGSRGFSAV
jgi:hypothetical protein